MYEKSFAIPKFVTSSRKQYLYFFQAKMNPIVKKWAPSSATLQN